MFFLWFYSSESGLVSVGKEYNFFNKQIVGVVRAMFMAIGVIIRMVQRPIFVRQHDIMVNTKKFDKI